MGVKPMLCELKEAAFNSPDYIWEPKLDGARIIAVIMRGQVRLWSRSGREKTNLYPELQFSVSRDCILDGEVVSGDSFNNIQHRVNRINGIDRASKDFPAKYSVFDILMADTKDVQGVELEKRKELLQLVCHETDTVSLTPWVDDGVALFEAMDKADLEGVVGKAKNSLYHQDKREWFKVKCWKMGVFYVVGYTPGTGHRANQFGALVLADEDLKYVGSVGTGFTEDVINGLMVYFSPVSCPWSREPERATWVKTFPVNIKYLEFTNDGKLRFPVFQGVV